MRGDGLFSPYKGFFIHMRALFLVMENPFMGLALLIAIISAGAHGGRARGGIWKM